ncbi:SDR family oxidoreductase [Alloalcanivorax mobilis]|uniref:SDR family oxidoreductase n=1 Tax=Alloalcanivorax mobilis TaxID=2019569 RepID=UPI000C78B707|nr:SDR family oxidoreductase [Alloalcanivorax mobilis]
MNIENCVALVTGANRGLGRAIAEALLQAGAAKVYAAARDPASVNLPGAIPVQLDVTDAASVRAAAGQCPDVTLLVNNAGIALGSGFLGEQAEDRARQEMDTNFFGPLATSRAFAPALAVGGGGAIVNVLSVLSWLNVPGQATYGASKAAAWALTNGLRGELESQNTQVVAVHVGYMDTDMTDGIDVPKTRPEDVAAQILAALEAGEDEVLADALSRQVKDSLSAQPGVYLRPPAG